MRILFHPITRAILSGIVAVIALSVFFFLIIRLVSWGPDGRTANYATTFTSSVIVITLLVGYYQFWNDLTVRQKSSSLEMISKRERTLDRYWENLTSLTNIASINERKETISKIQYVKWIATANSFKHWEKNNETEYTFSEKGKKIRRFIVGTIDCYEFIGLGIKNGVFDEVIIRSYFRSTLVDDWRLLEDLVNYYRTVNDNNLIGKEFEWIAIRWQKQSPK